MGKQHKKAKQTRNKHKEKLQQPPAELIRQSIELLRSGNPRQAIVLLKAALKTGETPETIKPLLFRAYLARAAQLAQKGMGVEAETIRQNALANLPDASAITDDDLGELLDAAPLEAVLARCPDCFQTRCPSAGVLEKIAGQLMVTRRWDLLPRLSAATPLHADAPAARQAADQMHAGEWESAATALKPVRRSSPYAPARIFCRAMVCFYAHDDQGMHRALAMIPEGSVFFPLARRLDQDPRRIDCLWDRPVCAQKDVDALADHLEQNRIPAAAAAIGKMARVLAPEAPWRGATEILMALFPMTINGQWPRDSFSRLVNSVLPGSQAGAVLAKMNFYHFENSLVDAAAYLKALSVEFPEPDRRARAASLVLTHTVNRMEAEEDDLVPATYRLPRPSRALFGLHGTDPELNPLEILLKAIDLDPGNREAYRLLVNTPRHSRDAKALVVSGLEKMMVAFPEDPLPCLELATVYDEKNAYRKAEQVLAEAKRRAPYDPRVTDRHVTALLVSFEKRLKSSRLHLAEADLEKARALCTDRTLPLVTAKTIRFQAENTGQLTLFSNAASLTPEQLARTLEEAVESFVPHQRLATLGLVALDLRRGPPHRHDAYRKTIQRLFKRFRVDIERLTSAEARDLMLPLGKEFQPLMPTLHRAGIYLHHYPQLLKRIKDQDLPAVLEAMVADQCSAQARKEIQERLKHKTAPLHHVLAFYGTAIQHLEGKINDAAAFEKSLAAASGSEKEMLRAASRRLASHARGRLAEALRQFDFSILHRAPSSLADLDDVPFDDVDDDFVEEMDFDPDKIYAMLERILHAPDGELPPEALQVLLVPMIRTVESLMDQMQMRGLPGELIHLVRDKMKQRLGDDWLFDRFIPLLTPAQIETLSPEAWEFLFGK